MTDETITIQGTTYTVEEVMDSRVKGVVYSAILKGRRGATLHFERYDDGEWVLIGGFGSSRPYLKARGDQGTDPVVCDHYYLAGTLED